MESFLSRFGNALSNQPHNLQGTRSKILHDHLLSWEVNTVLIPRIRRNGKAYLLLLGGIPHFPADSGNHGSSTTQGPAATQTSPITHISEPPPSQNFSGYYIGVGRADCTGQVSDINLMGYGKSGQNAQGLLTRLYSRAFILADSDGSNRMAFVSVELCMISQRLRLEVLKRLQSKYGSLYRRDNVILSGTHTHSGPAGYFQYTLYILASEGFSNRTFQYLVSGIVKSIEIAHTNLKPGKIFINKGNVANVQINRSPSSYLQNPPSERARYSSDTDKEMVVLKMVDLKGEDLGLISWFAIHPVSMNNSNHLVNSDNMGYAAYLFEQEKNRGYLPGQELHDSASQEVTGPVFAAHQWVNMTDVSVQINATHVAKTCKPALGYSFAAGTIDGVSGLNITQGTTEGDLFWDTIRDQLLGKPSEEIIECHKPKPILLHTGELTKPHPWHPDIVDFQIVTLGSLAIAAIPGEFTTMSGRRFREAVKKEFELYGMKDMTVVVSGLCNVYTHYITTYEEYQAQRYEAASTIYGPHTLSAYIQLFSDLAKAIATDTVANMSSGREPPFFENLIATLIPNIADRAPIGRQFGEVLQAAKPEYRVRYHITVSAVMMLMAPQASFSNDGVDGTTDRLASAVLLLTSISISTEVLQK
ncbi:Neutral ceramidase [Microtus ochrogaster]|uniref:Neutral ceramidase n=1 Tax=Microtus ochrogaster TaxID=79684 RepID=A0A8J6L5A1_MICOH|nr:Neutral ceramidase [Microtus ochrogaster]